VRRFSNGTVLTMPSKKSIKSFLESIRQVVKTNKAARTYNLVHQLNPIIRGWSNYHKHAASSRTFAKVDHQIARKLWVWAKRRHPDKSLSWVSKKYLGSQKLRNGWFFGQFKDALGQLDTLWLFHAASTPIVRHVPIRAAANPYDPNWKPYFDARKARQARVPKKGHSLPHRSEQEGITSAKERTGDP